MTGQSKISLEASEAVLKQTQELRDNLSGVNLDEEAADLIKYEMGYNASSRIIRVAQDIIDILFNAMR